MLKLLGQFKTCQDVMLETNNQCQSDVLSLSFSNVI